MTLRILTVAGWITVMHLVGSLGQSNDLQCEPKCSCVWYDSEKCECSAESKCDCSACTKDGKCTRCLEGLKKATGVIKGAIKSPYAKLSDAVVYIKEMNGRKFKLPAKNTVINQKELTFIPHILPVLVDSTVDFLNEDKVDHNIRSTKSSATVFDLGTYHPKVSKSVLFDKVGVVSLLCNIHAEMSAYIVVCQTPYFARTVKGEFVIRNVPPGTYKLTFFHEKLAAKEIDVIVEIGKETESVFTDLKKK